jgi:hypothetical protein
MIPPKEAVSNAKKYLREILEPEEEISDLRLEEVEFKEADKQWLITLGYLRPRNTKIKKDEFRPSFGAFRGVLGEEKQEDNENRIYKRLVIDGESGNIKSMLIREVH